MREIVLRGHGLRILAVTDGEAAFGPASPSARAALAELRAEERTAALEALGIARQYRGDPAATARRGRR